MPGPDAFLFCCDCLCQRFADDFNRADSSDLGANWSEVSGDWSINTNQLKEAGTSGAKVRCLTVTSAARQVVYVTAVPASGGKARIIYNWDYSANSYYYAEVHRSYSPTQDRVTINKITAGGAPVQLTVRLAPTSAFARDLVVCIGGGYTSISWGTAAEQKLRTAATEFAGGFSAGLQNGTAASILFDDFQLSDHYVDNPSCPQCDGTDCVYCSNDDTPDEIEAVVAGLGNRDCPTCTDLNGTYVCQRRFDLFPDDACIWEYVFAGGGPCGYTRIRVTKSSTKWQGWIVEWPPTADPPYEIDFEANSTSCQPSGLVLSPVLYGTDCWTTDATMTISAL